jgi:ABC-type bacteriocin/lantibiotic exporter with double-glycine peptidase domain
MARIRVWRCVTLVALTLPVGVGYAQERGSVPTSSVSELDQNASWDDRICGPRCVQYLLEYYELDREDLIDLVREVQWPDLEKGASLDRVECALRDRGIHTAPIVVPGNGELCWHSPVVVHLKDDKAGLGHFAVWLPESSGGEVKVWRDRSGAHVLEKKDFSRLFTGVALLTSRQPIGDPRLAIVNRGSSTRGLRFLMAATAVAGALFVFVAFRMRGRPSVSRFYR